MAFIDEQVPRMNGEVEILSSCYKGLPMPTIWPCSFTNGPPLLPGDMDAVN